MRDILLLVHGLVNQVEFRIFNLNLIKIQKTNVFKAIPNSTTLIIRLFSLFFGKNPKAVAPPPLTGEQYGKMKQKYPEGGHCQSVLHLQGVFNNPHYFK